MAQANPCPTPVRGKFLNNFERDTCWLTSRWLFHDHLFYSYFITVSHRENLQFPQMMRWTSIHLLSPDQGLTTIHSLSFLIPPHLPLQALTTSSTIQCPPIGRLTPLQAQCQRNVVHSLRFLPFLLKPLVSSSTEILPHPCSPLPHSRRWSEEGVSLYYLGLTSQPYKA